jgi:lambda family phage portal protein
MNPLARIFGRTQRMDPAVVQMDLERVNKELVVQARKNSAAYNWTSGSGYRYGQVTHGQKSPGGLSHSGMTRIFDHAKLRRNVRDAMYDSVEGRGIATRFADTIADVGLKIKLEPNMEMLGINEDQAEEWSRVNSSRFNLWLSSKDCTVDGVNTGYQNQWLYSFCQQRDNDMFVRLHYDSDPELMSPLQMQFIDPDQVSGYGYGFTSTNGVQYSRQSTGIEYDSKGREKSYTVYVSDPDKGYKAVTVPRKVGDRLSMLHGYRPEYAGQRSGYPLYTHLLQELEDITTLKQSHLQKAINQSSFGFYTKPSDDAPASGGPSDMANSAAEVIEDFLGTDEIDGMTTTEQASFVANIYPEMKIRQPGSLWNTTLAAGEDMRAVDQTAPADKFAEFADNLISYMSASAGMPIEVLLMKFGENYSASRATLVLLWRIVSMWRAEMASDFLNPLFQMWLSEEIAAGRTQAPGWQDPRLRAAWCQCRWIGTPVPTIDPLKEARAAGERANMGHETLEGGALQYNGSDATMNRAKLRKEIPGLAIGTWAPNWRYREDNEEGDND